MSDQTELGFPTRYPAVLYKRLRDAAKDNVQRHAILGWHLGKVIDVYDGDSCHIALYTCNGCHSQLESLSLRLIGYDTPEIRGRSDREKQLAREARDTLRGVILNQIVLAHLIDTDKYGRGLATLYVAARKGDSDGTWEFMNMPRKMKDLGEYTALNVNQWMLENAPARAYDGGARQPW